MLTTILIWLVVDALVMAGFVWMPVLRGEEAFFGVRVSREFYSREGRDILRRYRFWLLMLFVEIEAIGILVSLFRAELPLARVASLPLIVLPASILYILFYRQVKPNADAQDEGRFASAMRRRHLSEYTNLYLEAAVLLLMVVPSLFLIYYYPHLPERIPVHWNWKGEPDGWARKSFGSVFALSMLLVYLQGLFLLIKHGLLTVKMTLPADGAEEYMKGKEQFLRMVMRMMDWVRALVSLMLSALLLNIVFGSVEHLRHLTKVVIVVDAASTLLMIAVCVYFLVRLVTLDRKLKRSVGRVYVQRGRDAARWYAGGLFYYNPDDPALFVEKLVGFGYTFNLANRWFYVYLAYMILPPLVMSWGLMK
ncbi:MAG TPA: DUF1648 domain-containing protein [Pyrinomonadaceae bacterium]|nr:DUF1648 domain-containing protein [Pyrinomonadaceae bacterium]